jgi:hypothetical protein
MSKAGDKKEPRKPGRGQHPNSRANLRPQRADEPSHNPAGKPPGTKDRATLLRKWLETPAKVTNPESKEVVEGTVEDRLALAIIQKAMKGDVSAYREIQDSMHGPVPSKSDVDVDVTFRVVYADEVKDGRRR